MTSWLWRFSYKVFWRLPPQIEMRHILILRCLNPSTFIPVCSTTAVTVSGHGHASCLVQTQPHLQVEHCVLILLSKGRKPPRPAYSVWSCGHDALRHVSWEQQVRGYVQNSSLQHRYVHWITYQTGTTTFPVQLQGTFSVCGQRSGIDSTEKYNVKAGECPEAILGKQTHVKSGLLVHISDVCQCLF